MSFLIFNNVLDLAHLRHMLGHLMSGCLRRR